MSSLHSCDLCGATSWTPVVERRNARVMFSDRRVAHGDLIKWRCARCGLVSSGELPAIDESEESYRDDYVQALDDDHYFHTADGPRRRSVIFADWLVTGREPTWSGASRAVEIGAGNGTLLQEIGRRFPHLSMSGLELNAKAAVNATSSGVTVVSTWDDLPRSADIVYAIAVLEHVPSPASFLRRIHSLLAPGGVLILAQPTQDVPSYDVMFVDHLHQFGSGHLAAYAAATGFQEIDVCIGHSLMPNFSLHVWRRETERHEFAWVGPAIETCTAASAHRFDADVQAVNTLLHDLVSAERRIAVFGLSEVYALFRAYSHIGDVHLTCGMADTPPDRSLGPLPFPVVPPERAREYAITDALLTMNRIYYPQARRRLQELGITAHDVLST